MIVFTLLAGMVSIIAIDIFNGILMIFGVLLALPLALSAVGGWSAVAANVPATHFAPFGAHGPVWAFGVFFPTFFLLLGESSMYQKFFAAKDEASARKAVLGMVVGVVIIETCLALLAVIGAGKYWNVAPFRGADGQLDVATTETIILFLARHDLPVFAGCLLLGAGMAIIFSTANTFLMIPSTNLTRDIYQRFLNPKASESQIVFFQRVDDRARGCSGVPARHPLHVDPADGLHGLHDGGRRPDAGAAGRVPLEARHSRRRHDFDRRRDARHQPHHLAAGSALGVALGLVGTSGGRDGIHDLPRGDRLDLLPRRREPADEGPA